jgi:hypothetical protein
MAVPKTAALPLGYTPSSANENGQAENLIVWGEYKKKQPRARINIIQYFTKIYLYEVIPLAIREYAKSRT